MLNYAKCEKNLQAKGVTPASAGRGGVRQRSGRRPGDSGTRTAIRTAARNQFASRGYDRTTMRSVASEAGVDPALITHYFGSKRHLFADVVELPFDPAEVIPEFFAAGRDTAGARLARFIVGVLEVPESRSRMTSLVRAAASEPEAAELIRELIMREILAPLVEQLGSSDAELRASLAQAQVVGLIMARYIVQVEPLASLPPEALIRAIAPSLQRYLTEPLD